MDACPKIFHSQRILGLNTGYNTTGTHLTPCSEGNSQAAVQLEDFSAFEDAITRIESDSASKPAFRRRINSLETAQTEHTAFSGALLHPNHGLRARSEEPGAFDAFSSALSNSPRMRRKNMRESLDKVALSTQHEASMSAQSAATQRHRREKPSGWALYAQNYSLEMISTVSFDTMQRDDGTTTKNIRSKDRGAKSLHNSAVPRQTSLPDVKHGRADAKWQPVEPPRGRRWTLFGGRRRTTTQAETRTMEYASPQPSEWSGAGSPVDSAPKQRFSVRKIIQSSRKRSATITGHT